MKLSNYYSVLMMVLAVIFLAGFSVEVQAQQLSTTPKYVKTTVDTITANGLTAVRRSAIVTNQSATKDLKVWTSNRLGTRDTSNYIIVPAGKTLKITFIGNRIYRAAVSDSVYSQVYFGDAEINYNNEKLKDNFYSHIGNYNNKFVINDKGYLSRKWLKSYIYPRTKSNLKNV